MGNSHPTIELIRSITEYVNARYVSADRVASYDVEDSECLVQFLDNELPVPGEAMPQVAQDSYASFGAAYSKPAEEFPQPSMRSAAPPGAYGAPLSDSSKTDNGSKGSPFRKLLKRKISFKGDRLETVKESAPAAGPDLSTVSARSLEELVNNPGESFQAMLFRLIDDKGLTDPEVYNKAGVSRQTFSKIRSKEDYAPSKDTVISLALALGLTLDQAQDLLNTAGFALSNSSKSDIVISYFFAHDMHDLGLLNETLYEMGFALIGER